MTAPTHTFTPGATVPRPLLVTADPDLLDDLLRLVASAGVEADVAAHPQAARPSWSTAPVVVVGHDLAETVAHLQLPRRRGVFVVAPADHEADAGLWRSAVDVGAESVLLLPEGQEWLLERLSAVDSVDEEGSVVAVVGGRGGAGASLFAVAMCLAAVRAGISPMLVDADPWGGGADLLLGAEAMTGLRWPDLAGLSGQLSGQVLADALPSPLGVGVVSWDRGAPVDLPAPALLCVLDAAVRSYPLVVVDLPRRADALSSAVLSRAATTYLVVPAEVRAAAAAARTLAWLLPGPGSRLVVRTGRRLGLDPAVVATMLGVPLAAVVADDLRLAAAVDAGNNAGLRARSSLGRVADALVANHIAPRAAAVA
jgi:secretion/DNA translocation related CpaE-like protein